MEVSIQRTLPVRYDVDVFIAGGGPAGVAAAVAAAVAGPPCFSQKQAVHSAARPRSLWCRLSCSLRMAYTLSQMESAEKYATWCENHVQRLPSPTVLTAFQ